MRSSNHACSDSISCYLNVACKQISHLYGGGDVYLGYTDFTDKLFTKRINAYLLESDLGRQLICDLCYLVE